MKSNEDVVDLGVIFREPSVYVCDTDVFLNRSIYELYTDNNTRISHIHLWMHMHTETEDDEWPGLNI